MRVSLQVKSDTRKLEELQKNLKKLDREQTVSFGELFNSDFMASNTQYTSIDSLFEASGFKIEKQDDLESIPVAEWDAFIKKSTKFSSWEEMGTEAMKLYVKKQLGIYRR